MNNLEQVRHTLVIEDPTYRRIISLDGATYSIGRHSSNDIVLSCQKISRHHATLLRRTDVKTNDYSYWILDGDLQGNRSRNGIYINGKKCLVHELKHGDSIKFSSDAKAKYQVVSGLGEDLENIDLVSSEITPVVPEKVANKKAAFNKDTLVVPEQPSRQNAYYSQSEKSGIGGIKGSTSSQTPSNSFAELSPQPIIEIDLNGKITYINSAAIVNFKDIEQQKLSHPVLENLIPQCHSNKGKLFVREVTVDGKIFQQNTYYIPTGQVIRSYLFDITKQKFLEKQLQAQEVFKKSIFKEVTEGIIIVDGKTNKIIEANYVCYELLGYSLQEIHGMTIYELSAEQDRLTTILQKASADRISFKGQGLFRHRDGSSVDLNLKIISISSEERGKLCVIIYPATKSRDVSHDSLAINIDKRNIFYEQLDLAIANAQRNQTLLAIILFSIDFFPNIQETIGHEQSDRLLHGIAQRLQYSLRSGDTITLWQKDKFALLLSQIGGVEEVAKISQRIQKSLEQFFKIGEDRFSIKTNMGIAVYPYDGKDCDTLIKNANLALYRTQSRDYLSASPTNHPNNYQFYNSTMNSQASVVLHLENQLSHALERKEFKLYYQPQININDGNIQGIEALLRWEHPELGLVSPASFINLAEQTGLIIPIGEWVIRTACSQNKIWLSQGAPPLRVSVNVSPLQFQQPDFPETIDKILRETELEANLLELEVTTTTLMENVEYSCRILNQLQNLGVHISIDDFATGFSSLEYLKQFPFNTLKIDRTFIQELKNDPKDLAIISALVELGKGFNLRVVAEGVETQEQIELLRSLKCEQMQGFWFSRPLAAEETTKLLPFSYEEDEEEEDNDEDELDSEFNLNLNSD